MALQLLEVFAVCDVAVHWVSDRCQHRVADLNGLLDNPDFLQGAACAPHKRAQCLPKLLVHWQALKGQRGEEDDGEEEAGRQAGKQATTAGNISTKRDDVTLPPATDGPGEFQVY